jgi:hypothetical protein
MMKMVVERLTTAETTTAHATATTTTTTTSNTTSTMRKRKRPPPHVYFGYGAMCNPISRQRRQIVGNNFRPAFLPNYRIDFSNAGVASIVPVVNDHNNNMGHNDDPRKAMLKEDDVVDWNERQGGGVHGVLMEFDDEVMWERVIKTEKGYEHKQVWVYPYNNTDSVNHDDDDDDDDHHPDPNPPPSRSL